jgi:ABC-2 type transport system permease protein
MIDTTGRIGEKIVSNEPAKYFIADLPEDSLKSMVLNETLDGYLVIHQDFIKNGKADVYSSGGGGIGFVTSLNSSLTSVLRNERLVEAGIAPEIIEKVFRKPDINTHKITEKGTETDYAEFYAVIGYILGFVIYMMMFIYGAQVMRGVIEEKANRIIEVMASSVKSFELMMGKVVGLGLLGLTQLAFWIFLGAVVFWVKGDVISLFMSPEVQMAANMGQQAPDIATTITNLPAPDIGIIFGFFFYFLSGYFIYATLFAAIGSAVDQESDAQQLQFPIMMPLIIPMLFIQYIMSNPESTLAVILSLFPFFSPILMIVRIAATDVPLWQIGLSVVLMISTFFLCIWLASKIYRIGILMYGRKPQFRDLIKWARISG